jgi:hypothetical protein
MTPPAVPPVKPSVTPPVAPRSRKLALRASSNVMLSSAASKAEERGIKTGKPMRSYEALTMANALSWFVDVFIATLFYPVKASLPPYADAPNNAIYKIPDKCCLGIAADWGSGTESAIRVAEGIRTFNPDVTIHMGDVYFAGTPDEYDRIFIGEPPGAPGSWPRGSAKRHRLDDALAAYAMNGNHEMVSGGYGLIEHALPALDQKTTYFALENAHWRIVALDTGYTQPHGGLSQMFSNFLTDSTSGLTPDQEKWLAECVFKDSADKRPVILLSHHQPMSAFEVATPALITQLAPYLDRTLLWFWGHEHRLALYAPVQLGGHTVRGRLIGHAGMPIAPTFTPLANSEWTSAIVATPPDGVGLKDAIDGTLYAYCGYMMVTLEDEKLTVRYYNEDPNQGAAPPHPILEEVWTADSTGACTGRATVCDSQMLRFWPSHTVDDLTRQP